MPDLGCEILLERESAEAKYIYRRHSGDSQLLSDLGLRLFRPVSLRAFGEWYS